MGQTLSFKSDHFELHLLAEGVIAAIAKDGGSAICNAGLIDLGAQIVVFDTFLTPQAALDLQIFSADVFGRSPQIVINSHYHNDHIWGNQVFATGGQIISSTRTRELINTAGREEFQWYSANSAQRLDTLQAQFQKAKHEEEKKPLSLWLGYFQGLVEALPHLKVCSPGITFDSYLEMHGAKRTARLISYEGAHTGSDTILFLPQEGIIFMSDLLFVGCHPYLADGDPHRLLSALREISLLNATGLVPGYGPVGSSEDLKSLITYIEGCFDTAQELVDKGDNSQERIAELMIPYRYQDWQLSQFYRTNIEFLCKCLCSANENK